MRNRIRAEEMVVMAAAGIYPVRVDAVPDPRFR